MRCKHFIWINPFERIKCTLEEGHPDKHEGTDARNRGVLWNHKGRNGEITKGAGIEEGEAA